MAQEVGKRVRDLTELVDAFQAQEGEVQQIIGKTGNGKTYEASRRTLEYLKQGVIVYTTWKMTLPDFYDERTDPVKLFWRTLFFRKRFYKFDYKKNWRFLDIDRPDLIKFLSTLTDCVVMMDEGQDVFDSRQRMEQESRKTITRTRHMHKTLIIISQRAQAVDVTARANVTFFYKCVKTWAWFWPFATYFKVYRTEEMDAANFPIWEELSTGWVAELWKSHFARQEVYDSYDSWYLRAGQQKSQEVYFEAYDLSTWEKLKMLLGIKRKEKLLMLTDGKPTLTKPLTDTHGGWWIIRRLKEEMAWFKPKSKVPVKVKERAEISYVLPHKMRLSPARGPSVIG